MNKNIFEECLEEAKEIIKGKKISPPITKRERELLDKCLKYKRLKKSEGKD